MKEPAFAFAALLEQKLLRQAASTDNPQEGRFRQIWGPSRPGGPL